jgi:hypothetical protein
LRAFLPCLPKIINKNINKNQTETTPIKSRAGPSERPALSIPIEKHQLFLDHDHLDFSLIEKSPFLPCEEEEDDSDSLDESTSCVQPIQPDNVCHDLVSEWKSLVVQAAFVANVPKAGPILNIRDWCAMERISFVLDGQSRDTLKRYDLYIKRTKDASEKKRILSRIELENSERLAVNSKILSEHVVHRNLLAELDCCVILLNSRVHDLYKDMTELRELITQPLEADISIDGSEDYQDN